MLLFCFFSFSSQLHGNKRHIRAILVERVRLQHDMRVLDRQSIHFTEMDRLLIDDLLLLATTDYAEVCSWMPSNTERPTFRSHFLPPADQVFRIFSFIWMHFILLFLRSFLLDRTDETHILRDTLLFKNIYSSKRSFHCYKYCRFRCACIRNKYCFRVSTCSTTVQDIYYQNF